MLFHIFVYILKNLKYYLNKFTSMKKNNISFRPGTVIMRKSATKSPLNKNNQKTGGVGKSAKSQRAKVMDIIQKTSS